MASQLTLFFYPLSLINVNFLGMLHANFLRLPYKTRWKFLRIAEPTIYTSGRKNNCKKSQKTSCDSQVKRNINISRVSSFVSSYLWALDIIKRVEIYIKICFTLMFHLRRCSTFNWQKMRQRRNGRKCRRKW